MFILQGRDFYKDLFPLFSSLRSVKKVHVGFDDTDSRGGMCTTYLASIVAEFLLSKNIVPFDYPNLIRLNPNIPWKTRGNGAVALRLLCEEPKEVFNGVCDLVSMHCDLENGANPGVAMLISDEVPESLKEFSKQALWSVVSKGKARKIALQEGVMTFNLGNGKGLVGALSSIGNILDGDHSYELIAYRSLGIKRRERMVDIGSVIEMDRTSYPYTYNNYDHEKQRVLITPHGPDPVILGLRGESPEKVLEAFKSLRILEPLERYMIFRTNEGTSEHLARRLDVKSLKAFSSGHMKGVLSSRPYISTGGHVYFTLSNGEGGVTCAVYEPTGGLRKIALSLVSGDKVEVGGGVRKKTRNHPSVLNVEYIRVEGLADHVRFLNPKCSKCGKRMKSMGRNKGFRCEGCGLRDSRSVKTREVLQRTIKAGLYLPPPRAHRHLTKPLHRFGMERRASFALIRDWISSTTPALMTSPLLPHAPL